MKKIFKLIAVICLFLGVLTIPVKANDNQTTIIPLANGMELVIKEKQDKTKQVSNTKAKVKYYSESEASAYLANEMANRNEYVELKVISDKDSQVVSRVIDNAFKHTGNPKLGDSLLYQIDEDSFGFEWVEKVKVNGVYRNVYNIELYLYYFTDYDEEYELDYVVKELVSELRLYEGTEYERMYRIYDYLTKNVEYNYRYDDYYYYFNDIPLSAYGALVEKRCEYQGYALGLYRLCLEAGIDCRIISGYANGSHTWNIIGLTDYNDGKLKYYNCDSTFGVNSPDEYFLVGSSFNKTHKPDEEYTTKDFVSKYPLAKTNYYKDRTFVDVKTNQWYYQTIEDAYKLGLMQGVGGAKFEPNSAITRAMASVVLHRMSNGEKVNYYNKFKDVKNNQWYTNAIIWSSNNGIVNGYNNGYFGVDDPISRQDLIVMLRNYANSLGYDTNSKYDLSMYRDSNMISDYAKTAIQWGVKNGLIGAADELNPRGNATRAEACKILLQFYKKFL